MRKDELFTVSRKVESLIDSACLELYKKDLPTRLGASVIGQECSRFLWYLFRWVFEEKFASESFKASTVRLLERGELEETRFIKWLQKAGFQVFAFDESAQPDENGNFPQYAFSAFGGHFGGKIDAVVKFPKEFGIDFPVLASFKTHSTGRVFSDLKSSGVELKKPLHYAQECVYGEAFNLKHCLFMYINKNDDSMHCELVELSSKLGNLLFTKAESIINSQIAPPRISDNPKSLTCSSCKAFHVCHEKAIPIKNCRSCAKAKPVENGEWFCSEWNSNIPKTAIPEGCDKYEIITKIVEKW